MAGVKISALLAIPSAQLTDVGPFVQAGITYKTTLTQISTLFSSTLTLNTIAQVTGLPAALASYLPLAGGTMSGVLNMGSNKIISLTNPTNPQDAATKAYVDLTGGGFTVILSCTAGTTANLNATSAGAGIGATLTNAGAFAVFAVDGVTPSVGSRILVKNQTLTQHNGVYNLTTAGDAISVNWVLTRSTDYDTAAQIKPGTLIAVNSGTANATTSWLETATVVTVDTDPVLFSQFTFAPSAFFQIVNNLSEGVPATMRTNLGLGSVATKTASDAAKTNAAMVNGATTIGHIAVFSDVNGTIQDGGSPSGTVTSVATSGLATGGPITTTGTVTVTAAVQSDQETSTSTSVAVVPGVQQFHPSAAKAWARFQGNPVVIKSSYNVASINRNSAGIWTVTFTTAFSGANNYSIQVGSSNNSGNTNGCFAFNYTASTVQIQAEDGTGPVDAANVNLVAFGDQ